MIDLDEVDRRVELITESIWQRFNHHQLTREEYESEMQSLGDWQQQQYAESGF